MCRILRCNRAVLKLRGPGGVPVLRLVLSGNMPARASRGLVSFHACGSRTRRKS